MLDNYETVISKNSFLKGNIKCNSSTSIHGKIEGEFFSSSEIFVSKTSEILANIEVDYIIIEGLIKGDIKALKGIEMLEGSKVYGNVITDKLKIAENVLFEGKCKMLKEFDDIDIFNLSKEEIKNNLKL